MGLFNKAKDTISESKSQLDELTAKLSVGCLIKPKIQFLKANHNSLCCFVLTLLVV